MNISRFTQKSTEAVQECEKVAMEFGNQELSEEHLLMGLLRIDDSLILNLIEKMGVDTDKIAIEAPVGEANIIIPETTKSKTVTGELDPDSTLTLN